MLLTRIALIAAPEIDLQKIRSELDHPLKFSMREFLSMDEVNSGLKAFPFDVLMTRFRQFGQAQVHSLAKMREMFPKAALLSLVREGEHAALFEARNVPNHKVIYEKTELRDLALVVEKLMRKELSGLRLHPRTLRDGDAEVVVMDPQTSKPIMKWRARFVDFAQMGARLTLMGSAKLQQGCRAQLHYRSSTEPARIHRIESKVIWEKSAGGWTGQTQTVALRFIAAL